MAAPKVFISYSWDDADHLRWTKEFATRLRGDGVDATLDKWATVPGDRLPLFMEQAIRDNDYVLIVCTPNYKAKSDNRKGGVGYEGDIMTGEVFAKGNDRKYISILRNGDRTTAIPSWLDGKYDIDLTGNPYSEENYRDLLATLHNSREPAPPLGPLPLPAQTAAAQASFLEAQMRQAGYPWLAEISDSLGNRNVHSFAKETGGGWSHLQTRLVRPGQEITIRAIAGSAEPSLEFRFEVQRSGKGFSIRRDWSTDQAWVWSIDDGDIGRDVIVRVCLRREKGYYQFADVDDYTYATYDVLPATANAR